MLRYPEGARRRTWQELDALVLEEVEALLGRQQPTRAARRAPEAELFPDEAGEDDAPHDAAAALAEARDEEAFIDRSVEFLRGRPDAASLIEAIRAALAESEGEPWPEEPGEGEDRLPGDGADEAGAGEATPPEDGPEA